MHPFCKVTNIHKNYLSVTAIEPVNSHVARSIYIKKPLYSKEGIFFGRILSFHYKRRFIISIDNLKVNFKLGTLFYYFDKIYPKCYDFNGDEVGHSYKKCLKYLLDSWDPKIVDDFYYSKIKDFTDIF